MPTPTLTAIWQDIANGKTAPIDPAKPMTLGKSLTIKVDGDKAAIPGVLMVIVDSDGKTVASKLDTNYPWRAMADNAGLTLPAGAYTLLATPMAKDGKTALAAPLKVAFTIAGTPPVVTVPTPPAKPDNGNVPDGGTVRSMAWCGATIDASAATIPMLQKGMALGITRFRFFASGSDDNGNFGGWSTAPAKSIHAALPGVVTVGMYGRQEQSASQGRTAKPLTPDRQRTYWQQVAAKNAAAGLDFSKHWHELQNEFNANQYLNFGTSADNVTADRINYVMREAQYAREALGKAAIIVGPSVGYLANAAKIAPWHKALVSAGILDLVDYYNDHVYASNLDTLKAWVGGIREAIGGKPCVSTECNLRYLTLDKWPTQGLALVKVIADAKITPFVYRLYPNNAPGGVDMIPLALFDASGKLNQIAVDTWSMPVAG